MILDFRLENERTMSQTSTDNNFNPLVSTLNRLDLTTGRLQTFYSGPGSLSDLLFSPDQHSLAFTEVENDNSNSNALIMDILDLTTGKVHAVMSDQRPGFPRSNQWQQPTAQSSTPSFSPPQEQGTDHPLSGVEWNRLSPLQWVNNKSLFIFLGGMGSPGSVIRLYLLHDVGKDASLQQSNLQYIAGNDDPSYRCDDFAMMPDGQHLVCSNSPETGLLTPATIDVRSVTGGKSHTIYRGPVGHVTASIISNSTLLITQLDVQRPDALWKINIDGSRLTRLMVAPADDWRIEPSISNGSLYALTTFHLGNNNETDLVVGSLSGGTPTTIVKTSSDTLELMGWVPL
jgi:hypothetical protein